MLIPYKRCKEDDFWVVHLRKFFSGVIPKQVHWESSLKTSQIFCSNSLQTVLKRAVNSLSNREQFFTKTKSHDYTLNRELACHLPVSHNQHLNTPPGSSRGCNLKYNYCKSTLHCLEHNSQKAKVLKAVCKIKLNLKYVGLLAGPYSV